MESTKSKTYYGINEIANILIDSLHKKGFKLMEYKSNTSKSIYLKLDYGACYSIRISDHQSKKKKLNYRYNIITNYKGPRYKPSKYNYKREFYSNTKDDLNELFKSILINRKELIDGKFTRFTYDQRMRYCKKQGKLASKSNRFWKFATDLG